MSVLFIRKEEPGERKCQQPQFSESLFMQKIYTGDLAALFVICFSSIFIKMFILENECCPFVLGISLCITHGSPGVASHEQLPFRIQMFIKRLGLF